MSDIPTDAAAFEWDDFRFDQTAGGLARIDATGRVVPVNIGARASDILFAFLSHPGVVITKEDILAAAWPGTIVEAANLTVQISALRRVLDQGRSSSCIQTVAGRGYRFVTPVTVVGAPSSATAQSIPLPPRNPRRNAKLLVAAALLGCAMLGWAVMRGEHKRPQARMSVVVLPFANLGADPDQTYLADAITDDLTTDLSRIAGSVVIAHATAMFYRDKAADVRQIGRELDVRYVLEGSVRRSDTQAEVNARLVDTESAATIWSDHFVTDRRDLARAQGDITDRIANSLDQQLVAAVNTRIEREGSTDPSADDLAMRGWALWYQPFATTSRQDARAAFGRALQLDPSSGEARVGLATVLIADVGLGVSTSPLADEAQAEQYLMAAIVRDAGSSRAHEALGTLRRLQNRLDESRVEFETASSLNPNNPHALLGLAQTLMFLGRPQDAQAPVNKALRIDPRDPNIAFTHWTLGACKLLLGHLEEALDLLRRARAENPRVYYFHLYLAAALALHGDLAEARAEVSEATRLLPDVTSIARWNARQPWIANAPLLALRENTLDAGLRAANLPRD